MFTLHPERVPGLTRMGCIPFKIKQFLGLLEYSLSLQGRKECSQIMLGIDRKSISDQGNTSLLKNALFSHLPHVSLNQTQPNASTQVPKRTDQLLLKAQGFEEIRKVISTGIAEKIAALMAIELEAINMELPIADLGLDSLIAIELKNWIGRTLKAALQTSEILDTPSIMSLTALVAERSTIVSAENWSQPSVKDVEKIDGPEEGVAPISTATDSQQLPSSPSLPPLSSSQIET